MHFLIVSLGRLIKNGSAGSTVMCGLVEACLHRGHTVTHLALVRDGDKANAGIEFIPKVGTERLFRTEARYTLWRPRSKLQRYLSFFDRWFVAAYDHSYGECLAHDNSVLSESYDGVVAFESLAVDIVRNVKCRKEFLIIGDPVGPRLRHSVKRTDIRTQVLAALYTVAEQRHYRNIIQREAGIGMFGTWHAEEWTMALERPITDLRPMFPATEMETPRRKNDGYPEIAFGGTLASTASQMALKFLESELLPSLRKAFSDGFRLKMIGSRTKELERIADSNSEVILMGRVPSFEEELSKTGVFIAPMRYPVGVRTRVCSALAAGCFCICDESILRNLPELKSCHAVRIARTADDYTRALKEYFDNGNKKSIYEQAAKDFYYNHYDYKVAANPILSFLENVDIELSS